MRKKGRCFDFANPSCSFSNFCFLTTVLIERPKHMISLIVGTIKRVLKIFEFDEYLEQPYKYKLHV